MKKFNLFLLFFAISLGTLNLNTQIKAATEPGIFARLKTRFKNWRAVSAEKDAIAARERARKSAIKAQELARKSVLTGYKDTKKQESLVKKVEKTVKAQEKFQQEAQNLESKAISLGRAQPKIEAEPIRSAQDLIKQYERSSITPEKIGQEPQKKGWWERFKTTVTKPVTAVKNFMQERKEIKKDVDKEFQNRQELRTKAQENLRTERTQIEQQAVQADLQARRLSKDLVNVQRTLTGKPLDNVLSKEKLQEILKEKKGYMPMAEKKEAALRSEIEKLSQDAGNLMDKREKIQEQLNTGSFEFSTKPEAPKPAEGKRQSILIKSSEFIKLKPTLPPTIPTSGAGQAPMKPYIPAK